MKGKKKSRNKGSCAQGGKGKRRASIIILRQSGQPVNGVYSCSFIREVYDLISEPITVYMIAEDTESAVDRVYLALHDLGAAGVKLKWLP